MSDSRTSPARPGAVKPRRRKPATGTQASARSGTAADAPPTRQPPVSTVYVGTAAALAPPANLGYLIKQLHSSLTRMMDQRMAPLGLTAVQWRPLVLIRYRNINTPAELSRSTHIDTGAMTRALDRLEAKHFIRRQRCPDDRRVVRVELTDAGNAVAEHILPVVADTLNTHLQGFSHEEVDTLVGLIQRMLTNGGMPLEPCGTAPGGDPADCPA
ncbi:MarR family transcriptional regulator [Pusillimonas sp. TS35]|uniref:MarR family winged helix-turn-helix transcriptional regulator n=1 Tax=Paracandidimonas lactea TaxID=2895524 RepID=UPI00136B9C67|nr:MarR family transcriptional regulator [Paracandidimonas lactea]MYN11597.1 MarR family transcriptional regulator [Pusillimonas sp. TS35]